MENRITSLSEKEVKLLWTSNTLQSYCKCERAPRGLRSFKDARKTDFIAKWQKAYLDHSMNLLKIILERSKQEYECVRSDLNTANCELQRCLTEAQWQTFKKKIESKLGPIQNEIKERKREVHEGQMDYNLRCICLYGEINKDLGG